MSYSMFLDDIRDAKQYYPNQDMVVCRDFNSACEYVVKNGIPAFVSFDAEKLEGSLTRLPERDEINPEINEALVVEYYNKQL